MNPYEVLEVARGASLEEIQLAYRKKAQKAHPDKGGTAEAFKVVQLAWEVLSDPLRRKKFDDTGSVEGQGEDLRTLAMQSLGMPRQNLRTRSAGGQNARRLRPSPADDDSKAQCRWDTGTSSDAVLHT